jgi:ABC-type glycerol-3-phosphate transport system substrate-binding protein
MALRMAEQFNAALKGESTPQEAAETLQAQLQGILDKS